MFGRSLLNQDANLVGAGEADEIDVRVIRQCRTGFFADTAHDVQCTRWKSCFQSEFGDAQATQTRIFRRLDHHRVAHGQCWCNAASHHLRGVIPRNDVRGDTQRLAQQIDLVAVQKWNDFSVHFVSRATVKLKIPRQHHHVVARGGHGFASVFRFEQRQCFCVCHDQLTELEHQATAISSAQLPPRAIQCSARSTHRQINVSGIRAGDVVKHFPVNGRANL